MGNLSPGVRLLAKVKKKYGVDLKLATLFSAPTIEKLCALVDNRKAEAPEFHSLIPIRPNGTKPILFLVHEIEGSVIVFRDLVKHLDPDQPLWGVEYSAVSRHRHFLGWKIWLHTISGDSQASTRWSLLLPGLLVWRILRSKWRSNYRPQASR